MTHNKRASKRAQGGEAPVTKPGDPTLLSRTHVKKGESQFLQAAL